MRIHSAVELGRCIFILLYGFRSADLDKREPILLRGSRRVGIDKCESIVQHGFNTINNAVRLVL